MSLSDPRLILAHMLRLMLRPVAWFLRTPLLALFRVFVLAWIAAAVLATVAGDRMTSLVLWQLLAGVIFFAAGAVSAAWAAAHHPARKWTGYVVEGFLFASLVGFLTPSSWWTVLFMGTGAAFVELHRRYAGLRPWRCLGQLLAPLGRWVAALAHRATARPRSAVAALRARLSPSARAQRKTDRAFDELVATLDLDTSQDRG